VLLPLVLSTITLFSNSYGVYFVYYSTYTIGDRLTLSKQYGLREDQQSG